MSGSALVADPRYVNLAAGSTIFHGPEIGANRKRHAATVQQRAGVFLGFKIALPVEAWPVIPDTDRKRFVVARDFDLS